MKQALWAIVSKKTGEVYIFEDDYEEGGLAQIYKTRKACKEALCKQRTGPCGNLYERDLRDTHIVKKVEIKP